MSSNTVKIVPINCQGLADPHKKKICISFFMKMSYSIYLLQDTRSDLKLENCIRAEWGYKCYFVSYNSSSRGAAVLFYNNLEFSGEKKSA